jgi:tripartite-type tricarboxylate transporter receptor subunit TctC
MPSVLPRGALCGLLMAALALSLGSGAAHGQAYPTHAIRIVVPFSPGAGVTDMMARLIRPDLSARLGQQVEIDNRPGAAAIVATELVSKAPPDGYTLLMTNVTLVVNPFLYTWLPYDAVADFTPVTMINSAPLMLVVHPGIAAQSVQELIAEAKARPGLLVYGSGGVGSTPHLAGELFKSLAGIDVVHVPYKGGAPALADLVGKQLSFMIENVPGTMPYVRAGKLRALAITSAQRSPLAPDLPTMAEAGVPGYEVIGWNGLVAVKGTPLEIVARLHREIADILHGPVMSRKLAELGAEPVGDTPEQFAGFLAAERARWGKIIQDNNIRAE